MSFEELIKKHKPLCDEEDYLQDCWLIKLENPDMDEEQICIKVRKKYVNDRVKAKHSEQSIAVFVGDDEVAEDHLDFLVDDSTVEHNDFSYVDDDTKEHTSKLAKILNIAVGLVGYNHNKGSLFMKRNKQCYIHKGNKTDVSKLNYIKNLMSISATQCAFSFKGKKKYFEGVLYYEKSRAR